MVTVPPELPVKQVAALLVEQGISAVPVPGCARQLVGIVSEADRCRCRPCRSAAAAFPTLTRPLRLITCPGNGRG